MKRSFLRFNRRHIIIGLGLSLIIGLWLGQPVLSHLRAMTLLSRVAGAKAERVPAFLGNYQVDESLVSYVDPTAGNTVPARLFQPHGQTGTPGLVLIHGVHHLGLEEPRLKLFARTIAATGITVLTPEIRDLAAYDISPQSIQAIGNSVKWFRNKLGTPHPIGLMGLSFAGGLSLLAAADPQFAPDIRFVVAVGAHNSLARVSRFFVTNEAEKPDGTKEKTIAHPYGASVVVFAQVEKFFPAEDVETARQALKFWLWEQPDEARKRLPQLSPLSRTTMESLFNSRLEPVVPIILSEIERNQAALQPVSPQGKLQNLKIPVFLLHGAGDTVIPASETLWLERELPAHIPKHVLVTPLIGHVELSGNPAWSDEWQLVHFMAGILANTKD
ncbi:MAG: alpha/beta fold hydrolase [Blastocatellia bacterium]|nr:alpha/beta fold hydrolase [Blastocatellia bacterium]